MYGNLKFNFHLLQNFERVRINVWKTIREKIPQSKTFKHAVGVSNSARDLAVLWAP